MRSRPVISRSQEVYAVTLLPGRSVRRYPKKVSLAEMRLIASMVSEDLRDTKGDEQAAFSAILNHLDRKLFKRGKYIPLSVYIAQHGCPTDLKALIDRIVEVRKEQDEIVGIILSAKDENVASGALPDEALKQAVKSYIEAKRITEKELQEIFGGAGGFITAMIFHRRVLSVQGSGK